MSTQRLASNQLISAGVLAARRGGKPPRKIILDAIDDMLFKLERTAEAGEEIAWDTLRLEVGPDHSVGPRMVRVRATVEMHRDDVVAGLPAIAAAQHERGKR